MALRRMSDDLSLCTDMASDYIYIFCIPSSSGSRMSASDYGGTCSNFEQNTDQLLQVPGETCALNEELQLHTQEANDVNHLVVCGDFHCSNSDDTAEESPFSSSGQCSPLTMSVSIPETNSSFLSQHSSQRQAPVSQSLHSYGRSVCALGLSPSTLTPNTDEIQASANTDGPYPLRMESWFALPPYSPPAQRTATRRNIRRSARINLDGSRYPRRSRHAGHLFLISASEEGDKRCCTRSCCLRFLMAVTSFRWILLFFALIGVSCIISGIVLGSLHVAVGNSFLTLSVMFIGLGVLLVVVIGIGWRCTPSGHEPCHLLFNLGDHLLHTSSSRDRHLQRMRHHNGDHNQWFGGIIYPEFEYRMPPPSYNDSLQDSRQVHCATVHSTGVVSALPDSPPPAYRSETGTLYNGTCRNFPQGGDVSQPPSYRWHSHRRTPITSVTMETVPVECSGSTSYLDTVHSDLDETGDSHDQVVMKVLVSGERDITQHVRERLTDMDIQLTLRPHSASSSLSSSDADLLSQNRPSFDEWHDRGFSVSRSVAIVALAPNTSSDLSENDNASVDDEHFAVGIAV